MMITKLRRNVKALSPIFAVLILIAIAVIAAIVVYMFTSGFIGGLTGGTQAGGEKAAVQSASGVGGTMSITAYAQYVAGGSQIDINGAIVKDSDGTDMGPCTVTAALPTDGSLQTVTITTTSALTTGRVYIVTLTSAKGGSFTAPSFSAS